MEDRRWAREKEQAPDVNSDPREYRTLKSLSPSQLDKIRVLAVKYSPARTQGPHTAIQEEGQYSKKDTGVTLDLFKAASERN